MTYMMVAMVLGTGTVACAAVFISVFSYRKLKGQISVVMGLCNRSSQEINEVTKSVDAVLTQNFIALEQQRKASDHQRVLLASLNRQLVTLETMFDKNEERMEKLVKSIPARTVQSRPIQSFMEMDMEETGEAAPIARARTNPVGAMQQQLREVAANPVAANHQPLDNLVGNRKSTVSGKGARVSLEQRIRLQKHVMQKAQEKPEAEQPPVRKRPSVQSRETIDVLKMKERRVANG